MDVILAVHTFGYQGATMANEDRLLADPSRGLFAVFDGEFEAGRAAQFALGFLAEAFANAGPPAEGASADAWLAHVVGLLAQANSRLLADSRSRRGMAGTTAVIVKLLPHAIVIASVGDSRLYLQCHDGWRRGTRDHSLREALS